MTSITQTTELDAVNTMLNCINEAPVSSLEATGLADVAVAKQVLSEVSREVQTRGYYFNTEHEYPLNRNINNEIVLPQNAVNVVVSAKRYYGYEVVQRGNKLYWRNEHTFVFDRNLTGSIVFLLEFDQLPQDVRNYIMIRAARRFQARQLGSDTKHKFSEMDEVMAGACMKAYECNAPGTNMLNSSWSVAEAIGFHRRP